MTWDLQNHLAGLAARFRDAHPKCVEIDTRARLVIPNGTSRSAVNANPAPIRAVRGEGSRIIDADGQVYLDFCGDMSAGLFGHSPERIREAFQQSLQLGWGYGTSNDEELRVAELLCRIFPSLEMVRFTSSGTEACLMAIALAKVATGRQRILAFQNGFHGSLLSAQTDERGIPLTNVPHDMSLHMLNESEGVVADVTRGDVACVVVEPLQGSGGGTAAEPGFLRGLRELCDKTGTVLIFDEVMTSRLHYGGLQARWSVLPDLTVLGKYIAGGLNFGAFGGTRDLMKRFEQTNGHPLAHSGTFNNNIITMRVARHVLEVELTPQLIARVNDLGVELRSTLDEVIARSAPGIVEVAGIGSMQFLRSPSRVASAAMFHELLVRGFYTAPSGFLSISDALGPNDVNAFAAAFADVIDQWRALRFC